MSYWKKIVEKKSQEEASTLPPPLISNKEGRPITPVPCKEEMKEQPLPSPNSPAEDNAEKVNDTVEDNNNEPSKERKTPEAQQYPQSDASIDQDGRDPGGDDTSGRLQELLRASLEKNCTGDLDTMFIARRVRELLSIHNIGQRVFAKHVLGLSQGTVSELLSKPKLWDKLTEKGRDSYRKMYSWAADDQAILLLKSYVPRRGK